MIDTDTRHYPTDEITAEVIAGLDESAARFLAEAMAVPAQEEPARPLEELYRGRHRTTDELTTRITPMSAARAAVGLPLPKRAYGAAMAAAPVQVSESSRRFGRLGSLLRALRVTA